MNITLRNFDPESEYAYLRLIWVDPQLKSSDVVLELATGNWSFHDKTLQMTVVGRSAEEIKCVQLFSTDGGALDIALEIDKHGQALPITLPPKGQDFWTWQLRQKALLSGRQNIQAKIQREENIHDRYTEDAAHALASALDTTVLNSLRDGE